MEPVAPSPNTRGVYVGGDMATHSAASPLSAYYMRRELWDPSDRFNFGSGLTSIFSPSERNPPFAEARLDQSAWIVLFPFSLFFVSSVKLELKMPRSFLVKKYFPYKKQHNRDCYPERQTAFVPENFPLAELPTEKRSVLTCQPATLIFSVDILPRPHPLISPKSLPPSPIPMGPLDLSSSPSSSSGDEEEDGGRTSDPPSPDSMQPVYHCLHCSKSYTSLPALTQHQMSHQLPPCAPESPSMTTEDSTRPVFHCKHCPKEYNSLGALKMHIRSHTLPCVCTTCGKAFSRPWLLRGHIRTHTGERPFACQHCSRAFADRSNLRAHMQTHSEVKKYQCGSCSRTFSRMSLLNKHNASGCCPSS